MKWLLLSALVLTACARFPELDATVDPSAEGADFPPLIPIEGLLETPTSSDADGPDPSADVAARVANLRARAARLRGQIVDPATRARMQRGITNP